MKKREFIKIIIPAGMAVLNSPNSYAYRNKKKCSSNAAVSGKNPITY
jgi:hypothetical protein